MLVDPAPRALDTLDFGAVSRIVPRYATRHGSRASPTDQDLVRVVV